MAKITKREDGKWRLDMQPGGRSGKRIVRIFDTQGEAKRYQNWAISKYQEDPEWNNTKDKRRLSELARVWYRMHGQSLQSAQYPKLMATIQRLGDPVGRSLTASQFADYRASRLQQGISPATVNREAAYLKAMFGELKRLDEWDHKNPLRNLRPLREREQISRFLDQSEIELLRSVAQEYEARDVQLIIDICLSTGARWGEVQDLEKDQVMDGGLEYRRTKSGKTRYVPISLQLRNQIREHVETNMALPEEVRPPYPRVFRSSYDAFTRCLKYAGIQLPDGQRSHVLRHTFASHFMINGGNILTLQQLLGHQSITTTMRYAHLSPDHLQEATTLNPLVSVDIPS